MKKIEIIECPMSWKSGIFSNLTPGSQHEIVEKPEDVRDPVEHRDYQPGVWVMGIATPVKVLENEYKLL